MIGAGAASKDEARKVYDAFREAGGNIIDTANMYTSGTSESFLGEFMQGHRQSVVLATKYTKYSVTFRGAVSLPDASRMTSKNLLGNSFIMTHVLPIGDLRD